MKLFKRFTNKLAQPAVKIQNQINNYYIALPPSPQNALDIFKNEWSSRFPAPFDGLQAGPIPLFEDSRIQWIISELNNLQDQCVLELGPLEGGHSYMLARTEARSITAVEANAHAYLKCLISKELLEMNRVKFLFGDFVEYLRVDNHQFDTGVASGVLYHMTNPVELISLLAKRCETHIFLWTHYYDDSWAKANDLHHKYPSSQPYEYEGFAHTLVQHNYGQALQWSGFCGGVRPYSNWMYRSDIIECLKYFGFPNIKINFDQYDHPNGPAFAVLASRE